VLNIRPRGDRLEVLKVTKTGFIKAVFTLSILQQMNKISRRANATVITIALLSPMIVQGGPASGPRSEDAALSLLLRTLKHDRVYARRISLDCVTFVTEEKTDAYFQFVLRENHTAPCGGDPETSPVVDRYRIYAASGKIKWLEPVEGNWQRYNPAQIR